MNEEIKLNIWSSMLLIRTVEEMIAERYSEQEIRCPTHLSTGQELPSALFKQVVKHSDYAISTHRGHAHYLAKGGNLDAMIAELYGRETGCSGGYGGSMHLADASVNFMGTSAIVGNSIPIGVGFSLSSKLNKTEQVSFVFFGEGATEEGAFYEAANFATVANLPVVFICENNLYSVYSSLSPRQPCNRKVFELARSIGLDSYHCPFGDLENSYLTFVEASEKARNKHKPQFIEIDTYRWREHCGPNFDNDIGYRSEREFEHFLSLDPLSLLENELMQQKEIKIKMKKIRDDIFSKVSGAFVKAKKSPYPLVDNLPYMEYAGD